MIDERRSVASRTPEQTKNHTSSRYRRGSDRSDNQPYHPRQRPCNSGSMLRFEEIIHSSPARLAVSLDDGLSEKPLNPPFFFAPSVFVVLLRVAAGRSSSPVHKIIEKKSVNNHGKNTTNNDRLGQSKILTTTESSNILDLDTDFLPIFNTIILGRPLCNNWCRLLRS